MISSGFFWHIKRSRFRSEERDARAQHRPQELELIETARAAFLINTWLATGDEQYADSCPRCPRPTRSSATSPTTTKTSSSTTLYREAFADHASVGGRTAY